MGNIVMMEGLNCTWPPVQERWITKPYSPWTAFRDRYGDWGRDLALYLGRKVAGLKLAELGEAGGASISGRSGLLLRGSSAS